MSVLTSMILLQTELPIDLSTEKLTSLGVLLVILIAMILWFTYKICETLCNKDKENE